MAARLSPTQVHFLSLPTAIFCVQCELIGANTTPACLACGSKAVLSLSRLFGGSLRSQPLARLIEDDELNRLVRELLSSVPDMEYSAPDGNDVSDWNHAPSFSSASNQHGIYGAKIDLEPANRSVINSGRAIGKKPRN